VKLEYVYIKDLKSLWRAIKNMKIRGAPVLGVAAALGIYLGIKDSKANNFRGFRKELDRVIKYLGSSRPTAQNLFWGLERMRSVAIRNKHRLLSSIKKLLFEEADKIIKEDRMICRRMGYCGAMLVKNNDTILTICNTGILATIDYGTALGVIYKAKAEGKKIKVYACETRPLLQGARLTTWELKRKNIDVTLICDSMAATLMRRGKIKKVLVGADRIAMNGDIANKIGTYNLAVLARFHGIPFYVVAPFSTFDLKASSDKDIPIEERPIREVTSIHFKKPIAPKGINVFNPAFDITPSYLITAIVTERGIIRSPYSKNIRLIFKNK